MDHMIWTSQYGEYRTERENSNACHRVGTFKNACSSATEAYSIVTEGKLKKWEVLVPKNNPIIHPYAKHLHT